MTFFKIQGTNYEFILNFLSLLVSEMKLLWIQLFRWIHLALSLMLSNDSKIWELKPDLVQEILELLDREEDIQVAEVSTISYLSFRVSTIDQSNLVYIWLSGCFMVSKDAGFEPWSGRTEDGPMWYSEWTSILVICMC